KIVVRVKGYGQNEKRNIVAGKAISKDDLPIDIQYGTKETREESRLASKNNALFASAVLTPCNKE
ncbi:hypothetical protein IAF52_20285, partial [Acinetobacter baumannii]|nr:hypothetical protein [Acinetobacter baumannii]